VAMTAVVPHAPNYLVSSKLQVLPNGKVWKGAPEKEWEALPDAWINRQLYREHRTVVIPDYQGTGIGSVMSDAVARDMELSGYLYVSLTIHPFFGSYRDRSPFWRPCPNNRGLDKHMRPKYHHFWVGGEAADLPRVERLYEISQNDGESMQHACLRALNERVSSSVHHSV